MESEFRYFEMSREEREALLRALAERLESERGIVFAYVHGGFVERSFFRDVDVAVWVEDEERAFYYTVDLSARMESELGVPVDVQVLNGAPIPFRYWVFTRGRLLFSRDEGLRARVEDAAIRMYLDFREFLRSLGLDRRPTTSP